MKLDGRRESSHVEDRRGMSTKSKAGLGIGGTLIVVVLALLFGGKRANEIEILVWRGHDLLQCVETGFAPF